ncbi:MAG TPA: DUF1844 domain-containing protein [Desulfosalsimonadaceae bacterium]|nr:DUF1844 domain-containing protein [Desulfosalsimonadaceae bacterium]
MSGENHQDENGESPKNSATGDPSVSLPEISFSTFIMSLNSSALVHLGLEADPSTGKQAANLPFAKQTIDILAMLEEKTSGNLSNDEQRLLTNILYELRLMYVKQKKGGSS